jgi:hypothetical protein
MIVIADDCHAPIAEEEPDALQIERDILVFRPILLRRKPNYQIRRAIWCSCHTVVNDQHDVAVAGTANAYIPDARYIADSLTSFISH